MRILVDTSVWSGGLRRKTRTIRSENTFIHQLISNDETLLLTGIILQEVLLGIRSEALFSQIRDILVDFECLHPDLDAYVAAASLRNHLARKGISAGTIDCLISAVAISNDVPVATADDDFLHIARHSPLRVITQEEYLRSLSSR